MSIVEEFSVITGAYPYRIIGFCSIQVCRGESICPKKRCLTLNALNAAKLLQFLLNPQKANQFTAEHVSQNAEVIKQNDLS